MVINFKVLFTAQVPEGRVKCKSFTIIFTDSLLVYDSKYYLQVYLNNRSYKVVKNQIINYFDDNLFEPDEDQIL